MANFMGWQKYIVGSPESVWGTYNSGAADLFIPYTEYSVQTVESYRQADLFLGVRQRRHNVKAGNIVQGNLACPLFGVHQGGKSIAQWLIEWATSGPATPFVDSFTFDAYEAGVDNKRHTGLRVASMSISGDADSNAISTSLSLIGKDESGGVSVTALDATTPQPVEFTFDDVKLYLQDGVEGETASTSPEEVSIRSFSLNINNNLKPYRTNSLYPTAVVAGVRTIDFSFAILKDSNTYDALRRSSTLVNKSAQLVMKGQHLGTASGTKTVARCYFDRLNFAGATDQVALNDLVGQTANWIVLKPNTTENDIEFAFGTE